MFDWNKTDGSARQAKIGDTTLIYTYDGESAHLISLRTPAAKRNQGSARRAMEQFLRQTDALGIPATLECSPLDKRTKDARLFRFYRTLGFEPTGKRINAAGDPEMARPPQPSAHHAKGSTMTPLTITLDNYLPDSPSYHGRVAILLGGSDRLTLTCDDIRDEIALPHALPPLAAITTMNDLQRSAVLHALAPEARDYLNNDPAGIDENRIRILYFADQSQGFVILHGEAGYLDLIVGQDRYSIAEGELLSIDRLADPFSALLDAAAPAP